MLFVKGFKSEFIQHSFILNTEKQLFVSDTVIYRFIIQVFIFFYWSILVFLSLVVYYTHYYHYAYSGRLRQREGFGQALKSNHLMWTSHECTRDKETVEVEK